MATTGAVIQWLASADMVKQQVAFVGKDPVAVEINGDVVKEPNAMARAVAKAVDPALGGIKPVEQAQVAQWQAWAGLGASQWEELDQALATRSFLAGQRLTLADVQVYFALAKGVEQSFPGPMGGLVHVLRWFDQVQHSLRGAAFAGHDAASLPKLLPVRAVYKPISMPVFAKEGEAPAGGGGKQGQAPPQQAPQQQPQGQQPKEKPQGKPPKEGGAGAKGGEGGGGGGGKREKQGKGEKKAPAPAAEAEDLSNPNLLEIKVGQITKAWPHPESDKLWCEEIDLGEETPRQIASGLRHFYANESDLEGRLVLVLANLKPRKLAGFASNGMVLCASNAEHTEVKFVEVPASAKVGDRVVFAGEGVGPVVDPLAPNTLAKKKVFELIAPGLMTDAKGVCNYKGAPFAIAGSGEVCTAPLPNAHVS